MRRHLHRLVLLSISCAALLLTSGCSGGPTFHKETLVESVQEVLRKDQIDASVRIVDHTLALQLEYPGILERNEASGQIGLGPKFDEVSRKVIFKGIHRVLLSSDADIQFYLLLLSDPDVPGAYLTMVRYFDDIKKVNVSIIGPTEMISRTVFELNMAKSEPLTLESYLPREILLSEFLTWQLQRRIQSELTKALQSAGTATVGRCQGEFSDGEFLFVLNIVPSSSTPLDEDTVELAFDTATDLIGRVLAEYEFESFDSIRLIHPMTGRNFVLERGQLPH